MQWQQGVQGCWSQRRGSGVRAHPPSQASLQPSASSPPNTLALLHVLPFGRQNIIAQQFKLFPLSWPQRDQLLKNCPLRHTAGPIVSAAITASSVVNKMRHRKKTVPQAETFLPRRQPLQGNPESEPGNPAASALPSRGGGGGGRAAGPPPQFVLLTPRVGSGSPPDPQLER